MPRSTHDPRRPDPLAATGAHVTLAGAAAALLAAVGAAMGAALLRVRARGLTAP
ncbi:hypothetical protein [Cellulomonas triticagri]|uniref:hypothetical protein n=1 Tax=Cellulomonas triticagri TaxID=2483352 RepID=UPI001315113C|nr:hypothetical protein [Cellulomonas triticagri]